MLWSALIFVMVAIMGAQKPPISKLGIEILKKVANCRAAAVGEILSVHYTGKFYHDNVQFETSVGGKPFEFELGKKNVIAGWDQGLLAACVGEKRRLIIPPDLAYGIGGTDGIPPNSILVFDIEILTVNKETRQDGYKVFSLPLLSNQDAHQLDIYAGHIQIGINDKYFHLLVRPKSPNGTTKKVVFWLNGGPGCSSMDGMFLEIGPLRFQSNPLALKLNHDGWWNEYELVFLDQPSNVGYSVGKYFLNDTAQVVNNFAFFLDDFLEIYPEYNNAALFLAGESYAGVWIPYISQNLLKNNHTLKAIILGNPWLDPLYQYPAMKTFAANLGLLPGDWLGQAEKIVQDCNLDLLKLPKSVYYSKCERIMQTVLDASREGGKNCINKYDYTLRDKGPLDGCGMAWPAGIKELGDYMARADVKNALHATDNKQEIWTECNWAVYNHISRDPVLPPISLFPELLEKITISVYAGDKDLLCNWVGLENTFAQLEWGGSVGMLSKPTTWREFGLLSRSKNLSFFILKNASHMSPFDAPLASYQVMKDTFSFLKDPSLSPTKLSESNPHYTQKPSQIVASFFLLSCFTLTVVGGLFIRRKISNSKVAAPSWNAVPNAEHDDLDMELNEMMGDSFFNDTEYEERRPDRFKRTE